MIEQFEELSWSDLYTPNPYDDAGNAALEESFGIVFDETHCARGAQCINPPSWAREPCGAFIGPGLDEDENGYPRGTFTSSWYFPSAPTYQFCEDCMDVIECDLRDHDTAEVLTVIDGALSWDITVCSTGFDVLEQAFDWQRNDVYHEVEYAPVPTFGEAIALIELRRAETQEIEYPQRKKEPTHE